jgi:UPF0271 protein
MATIDLNSDLGEGVGDDAAMLELVTSVNLACGFHAGDPLTMRAVSETAARKGIVVGAHVSYRDRAGFGRRDLDVDPAELAGDVLYQLAALDGIAAVEGITPLYVKPHGALYNRIVDDADQAESVAAAVSEFERRPGGVELAILGLSGSQIELAADRHDLRFVAEAFVDRGYLPNGTLVPRSQPGALLTDPDAVATRAVEMVTEGRVTAVDGSIIPIRVESLCVHGDTPGAVLMAEAVRAALDDAGITVRSFA